MAFDTQPTLIGDLVALRPLRPDDFDALYAVASDPLIWEQHPDSNRHERPVFEQFFREALASGGAVVALDRATGAVIGSSRYWDHDEEKRQVEVGWTFLTRPCWGGRYNAEMKRLMLEHAFRFVDRVVFVVGVRNFRSQRAVEKIGGVLVGTRSGPGDRESVVFAIEAARTGWTLISAEARHAASPATFEIPSLAERRALQPGDGAKLLFDIRADGDRGVDRMWVIVRRSRDGRYLGVLDSDPGGARGTVLRPGSDIAFGPEHVADIDRPSEDYVRQKYGVGFFSEG